jgi:hypothetical protein
VRVELAVPLTTGWKGFVYPLIGIVLLSLLVCAGTTQGHDVDFNSGRHRVFTRVYGVRVSEDVVETHISEVIDSKASPDWHYVGEHWMFSTFTEVDFPADAQTRRFRQIWFIGKFSDELKRVSAERLLAGWRECGEAIDPDGYMLRLEEFAIDRGRDTEVSDLPEFFLPAREP